MKMGWLSAGCAAMLIGGYVLAQAPTTMPSATPATMPAAQSEGVNNQADQLLDSMLKAKPGNVRPLQPLTDQEQKPVRSAKIVAPAAGELPLKPEGSMLTDRVGRLQKAGEWTEFRFESDGRALNDPPMVLLPNSELARMEQTAERARTDLRFRVTGVVTVYGGRNYLLVERARTVSRADEE